MKVVFSVLSGALAALAGVAGKLAFADGLDLPLRACGIGLVLGLNALMLTCFVRALREDGSVVGTTINMSANVATSSLIGAVFFGEADKMTQQWFVGSALVLAGVALVTLGQHKSIKTKSE